ncbi:hypothetical protein PsYK624_125850 [Phanerochaete sordida]|uniref:Uncharacterized protein n=1 Tax=Phanerochaete sordida TaxID=48140 RepID=A0A9P3GLE4_9APHY|nr:hypothetical protein PsYK624_125850 [Phanerochaete sordida]
MGVVPALLTASVLASSSSQARDETLPTSTLIHPQECHQPLCSTVLVFELIGGPQIAKTVSDGSASIELETALRTAQLMIIASRYTTQPLPIGVAFAQILWPVIEVQDSLREPL